MGTLRIMIKNFRLRRIIPADEHGVHPRFPVLVFVITLMIGIQLPITSCSGNVDLARPYLFRDYGMLASYAPQHTANLYHRQKSSQAQSSSQYSDSGEDEMGGSSEEDDAQYTEPVIVDIDDPEEKARWMGLSDLQESFEEYDEDEYEESLSSREFMSRSSQQPSEKSDKNDGGGSDGADPNGDGESRGIMDNFNFNPFSFWQGDGEETQSAELPQSDEIPEFSYYPYAYEANPTTDYYYDPNEAQVNEQKEPIVPNLAPVQIPKVKPKPKLKPKPKRKSKPKPKPKPAAKPKPKKPKPKKPKKPKPPPPPPGMMRPKPKPMLKDPAFSQQFHYQEYGKPDKLQIISDKLSKINPFNYLPQIQIQKPQIKIEKHGDTPPPPPPHMMQRPPPMKRKKPPRKGKKPSPPKPMKRPPPSMMQTMMSKMKPKPKHPKPKHKQPKPKKPMEDEPNPELVMYFGQPFGGPFGSQEIREAEGQEADYRNEGDDDEEEADDDDDDDDDEDEEEDEEDDADDDDDESDYVPQVGGIKYTEFGNGGMSEGEASMVTADQDQDQDQEREHDRNQDQEREHDRNQDQEREHDRNQDQEYDQDRDEDQDQDADAGADENGEEEAEETTSATLIEDDEGDYEDQVIGLTTGSTSTDDAATRQEDTDQKEKSITFTKLFGWRKKKRRHPPRKRKRHPARRPPNWKQYRPAPLLPEIPEGISDTVLRVINKVGFLPEYDKTEKYGGHNKIKGKFTHTRPITLHHGLLTEVLRRR